MGESDRYIEYRGRYRQPGINFNINSPVVLLIIFNFSIFLFVQFLSFGKLAGDTAVVPFFNERINTFFVPGTFGKLITQPWSAITYSFFHYSLLNITGNMLWLWCFGSILQSIVGNRHTFPLYLYGAVAGAVVFTLASQSLGMQAATVYPYLFGANAAIMAVAVGACTIAPDFKILQQLGGGFPIWILAAVYIIIDLIGMRSGAPVMPFYLSHIAGAVIGFAYMLSYKKGYNWGGWMNKAYYTFMNLFNPDKKKRKPASVKEKVFYNTGTRQPYHKTAHITQQRVDEILDKISQKGFNHLTEEEKNILKRAGEEEL